MSCPNRGHRLSEFPDDWKQSLMAASHKSKKPGGAKLTRHEAWFIKYCLLPYGISISEIAKQYSISTKSVKNISKNITWGWLKEDDY